MKTIRILAVVLIAAGVLSLAYGGFTYVEDTHDADLGPIEFSVTEKETVNIPTWAGVLCIVAGVGLAAAKWRSFT